MFKTFSYQGPESSVPHIANNIEGNVIITRNLLTLTREAKQLQYRELRGENTECSVCIETT